MPLTTAQLQAIQTHIEGDATLNAFPNTPDGNFAIAEALNAQNSPDFWVWRTRVTKADLTSTPGPEGTTFTWAGNGFVTRSVGELMTWQELFDAQGAVNASLANVRQAFTDIFSGSGNAASNRTHLAAVARRRATRGERVLATGTGSTGTPGLLTFEGLLTHQDVEAARNLP